MKRRASSRALTAAAVAALTLSLHAKPPAWVSSGAAPSPVYTLPIHAVLVSNGSQSPSITPAQVGQWVNFANTVYDDAGVQFYFDANNPDMSSLTNATLAKAGCDGDGDYMDPAFTAPGNAEAAKHPGKVVVFFRPPPSNGPPDWTCADASYHFIVMPDFSAANVCGHQNLSLFAHQVGHYLGLRHTHALDPIIFDTKAKYETWYLNNGKTASLFDGDGLSDTFPDPFLWENQCDAGITAVTLAGVGFPLPRTNIMSLYDNREALTAQQIDVVRKTVEDDPHGLLPSDPAIQPATASKPQVSSSPVYESPDIWFDSSFNGYGIYADWQGLDSEGVPTGAGDPFWPGKLNYIHYRIRNLGPAAAANVRVQVTLIQPLIVSACPDAADGTILATQNVGVLEPGESLQGKIPWVPKSGAPGLVRVRILDTPFELSTSNNQAQENLGTVYLVPGSTSGGGPPTQGFNLALINPCNLKIPIYIEHVGLPPDWNLTIDPVDLELGPGEARRVHIELSAPHGSAPGAQASVMLKLTDASGGPSALAVEIPVAAQVALPVSLRCTSPTSSTAGLPMTVGGQVTPAEAGSRLWFEYLLPDGSSLAHRATVDAAGSFADGFTPSMEGPWTVRLFTEGGNGYQPGTSPVCGFRVGPSTSQPSPPSFDHTVSATEIFYRGASCGPREVEIRARLVGYDPASIVAFYRLRDREGGGTTSWNDGAAMSPVGDGWFRLGLSSDDIPGVSTFARSWIELQLVAADSAGQVLFRSQVTQDVSLSLCPR